MKRPNITPGSWKTNEHGRIIANGDTLLVKGVALPHYRTPEIEDNSRAVAAIPRLLEVLESIVKDGFSHHASDDPLGLIIATREMAKSALREAGYTFD